MSIWTHVSGCIRIDCISFGLSNDTENIIKAAFGNTCGYDDDSMWDNCSVPCGSEGSIQYGVVRTGSDNSISWGLVYIWGDLRDYSNFNEIFEWINHSIDKLFKKGIWQRQVSICITIEGGKQYLIYSTDNKIVFKELFIS